MKRGNMSSAQAVSGARSVASGGSSQELVTKMPQRGIRRGLHVVRNDESGMSTAEYAVGTVAAAGLGGVLIKLLSSPEVQALIWSVITKAFSWLV